MPKKLADPASPMRSRPKKVQWTDPDDAPEITNETLDRATVIRTDDTGKRDDQAR